MDTDQKYRKSEYDAAGSGIFAFFSDILTADYLESFDCRKPDTSPDTAGANFAYSSPGERRGPQDARAQSATPRGDAASPESSPWPEVELLTAEKATTPASARPPRNTQVSGQTANKSK